MRSAIQERDLPAKIVSRMTIAGMTLPCAFIVAIFLLATAPTDSGQMGAGHGAVSAASALTFLWVIGAGTIAAFRWGETTFRFRLIFLLNAMISCALVAQFLIV